MIKVIPFADRIQGVFQTTERGVVGLVDDLLGLCRLYQLRINFRDDRCCVRRPGADDDESMEIPVPKSVFRAALARIAALCNEQHPGSVTPYRGEGTVSLLSPDSEKTVAPSTCYVSFTNSPRDQHLEMRFSTITAGDRNRFTVLLRDKRTVSVLGHALRYLEPAASQSDPGSYGIVARTESGEVLIALFPVSEVIGVFSGDVTDPGESWNLSQHTGAVSPGEEVR